MPAAEVTLRQATAANSEFACQVRKATFRGYLEMASGWDEAEQRRLHEKRLAAQEFRVIQASGEDVGILAITRVDDCVRLHQLFILPEHQGKGIGKACMERVIQEATESGLPVHLQVLKVNGPAQEFYRKLGFQETGQNEWHILMERRP